MSIVLLVELIPSRAGIIHYSTVAAIQEVQLLAEQCKSCRYTATALEVSGRGANDLGPTAKHVVGPRGIHGCRHAQAKGDLDLDFARSQRERSPDGNTGRDACLAHSR